MKEKLIRFMQGRYGIDTLNNLRNAGSTLHIGGNRRTSHHGPDRRTDRIGHHCLLYVGNLSVFFHNACFRSQADQCTDRIEYIHKQQGKDDDCHIQRKKLIEIKLAERRSHRMRNGNRQEPDRKSVV